VPDTLGLLAGAGDFPAYLLEALKARGFRVVVVGFKGETPESLLNAAESGIAVGVGEFQGAIDFLREAGVREAFMAGTVAHTKLYAKPKTDSLTSRVLATLADRRAATLLKAAIKQLRRGGVRVISPMGYLKPLIPERGTLTRRQPSLEEMRDVAFGRKMARRLAGLDIGQTVVVKDRAVLAVEALEGTDETIARGGRLGRGGVVVVKVARPRQDFRFDVPVIGVRTIEALKAAGAAVLAVEAGRTIALERPRLVAMADEAGLCVVAE